MRRVQTLSNSAARQVADSFDGARSIQVSVLVQDADIVIQGRQATVKSAVTRAYQMKNLGAGTKRTDMVTFMLAKRDDGSWVIVSQK